MEPILDGVSQYLTKESLTVLASLAALWVGYKAASKAFSFAKAVAKPFSMVGVLAAAVAITGVGGAGFGVGELITTLVSGDEAPVVTNAALTNDELVEIAKDSHDTEPVFEYIAARDLGVQQAESLAVAKLVEEADVRNTEVLIEYLRYLQHKNGAQPVTAKETATTETNRQASADNPFRRATNLTGLADKEPTLAEPIFRVDDPEAKFMLDLKEFKDPAQIPLSADHSVLTDSPKEKTLPVSFALVAIFIGVACVPIALTMYNSKGPERSRY